jgi:hypothetical protein
MTEREARIAQAGIANHGRTIVNEICSAPLKVTQSLVNKLYVWGQKETRMGGKRRVDQHTALPQHILL